MKKVLMLAFALVLTAALGFSQKAMAAEKAMGMAMTGYIIDTKCATANKDKLEAFVPAHEKECAMMPDCAKSGYNLYSEGKLYTFDKKSNAEVTKFLKKSDSTLHVTAEVKHGKGDIITLVSIANAK